MTSLADLPDELMAMVLTDSLPALAAARSLQGRTWKTRVSVNIEEWGQLVRLPHIGAWADIVLLHAGHITLESHEVVTMIVPILHVSQLLRELHLNENHMMNEGIAPLATALPFCPLLVHLNVSRNYLTGEGVTALAAQLPALQHLEVLDLSSNQIEFAGTQALAGVLAQLPSLLELNLSHNVLQAQGAEVLANVLHFCMKLSTLDVTDNSLGITDDVEVLAAALPQCNSLTILRLSENYLCDNSASDLADFLPHCQLLQSLNLAVSLESFCEPSVTTMATCRRDSQGIEALAATRCSCAQDGAFEATAVERGCTHANGGYVCMYFVKYRL